MQKTDESKPVATATMPSKIITLPEPEDDLHVADMDIDNQYVPNKKEKKEKKKKFVRMAAGTTWEDQSLSEWDPGRTCFSVILRTVGPKPESSFPVVNVSRLM